MVNGQDKKILIVEKQPNYTQQLVKQVMFAGLSPVVAVTGEGGIRKAIEHHPDLILLELDLTDMDGLRFVSLLKRTRERAENSDRRHEHRRPNESRGAQGRLQRLH